MPYLSCIMNHARYYIIFLSILSISCSHSTHKQYKGYYKIGSRYTINGETYHPQYYHKYEELGIASWYSDNCYKCSNRHECDKCVTANGELFNKNLLTAAHRTLPMPSMVKVTNLENGKILKLKVNDRGPFKNNRIIDVSEKAAEKLGFKEEGLATVRVEYLKRSTEKFIHSKPHYKKSYRRVLKDINRRNNSIFSPRERKQTVTQNKQLPKTPKNIKHSRDITTPKTKKLN